MFVYVKTAKIRWLHPQTPLASGSWGVRPPDPRLCFPPLAESWVHHCIWGWQFLEPPRAAESLATPLIRVGVVAIALIKLFACFLFISLELAMAHTSLHL